MKNIRQLGPAIALSCAALTISTFAMGQAFPAKPVRIVVTFTTGGAADITARVVGERLSETWKQPVIIENRIGAGGNIGVETVYRASPDGYTLLMASNTHAINQALYTKLPFELTRDFAGLGLTTSTPMVLAVNPRVPVTNLVEFTDMLRAHPGALQYATCGVATAHHFAMEMYKYATQTSALHIPHRGCTPAVVDAVGGQVDIVVASLAAVLPHSRQGRLRIIALTTRERSPTVPDIPTMRESGIVQLKDFGVENYYGFMAPAATPRPVLARIGADVNAALDMPVTVQRLNNAGLDLYRSSAGQMMALLRSDIETFRKAIEIAGIKPE